MAGISIREGSVDAELYNNIMNGLLAGNNNELILFILDQRNWIEYRKRYLKYEDGTPEQSIDDMVGFSQSRRLLNIYITAIWLLRDYAKGGVSNLHDERAGTIMDHRSWYLKDYIFPPILKKMWGNTGHKDWESVDGFYKHFRQQSNPKYGVVQSILIANDFDEYLEKWNTPDFFNKEYTQANYMDDLQLVFDNIINGRSIVLMEPRTIDAFNKFGKFCCDKTNPHFKPEYVKKAKAAAAVVQQDWDVEKARLAQLRQASRGCGNGYDNGRA